MDYTHITADEFYSKYPPHPMTPRIIVLFEADHLIGRLSYGTARYTKSAVYGVTVHRLNGSQPPTLDVGLSKYMRDQDDALIYINGLLGHA